MSPLTNRLGLWTFGRWSWYARFHSAADRTRKHVWVLSAKGEFMLNLFAAAFGFAYGVGFH